MAKKNYKKGLTVGLIWSAAYLATVIYYVKHDLGFNLISPGEWHSKYIAFTAGQWSLDSQDTLLFFLTAVLFFPVWIIGWVAFSKVNWYVPRFTKKREASFKREIILKPAQKKLHMPVKLRLQHQSQVQFETPVSPQTQQQNVQNVLSTAPIPSHDTDVQDVIDLAKRYEADTFQNIVLDDLKVPVAVSTDETALLITFVNIPDAQWVVDLSDGIGDPWFSQSSRLSSPAEFIQKAADALQALEPDSHIIPVVVITDGCVFEASEVAQTLAKYDIKLVRFKQGAPESLETLSHLLDQTFERKTDEK